MISIYFAQLYNFKSFVSAIPYFLSASNFTGSSAFTNFKAKQQSSILTRWLFACSIAGYALYLDSRQSNIGSNGIAKNNLVCPKYNFFSLIFFFFLTLAVSNCTRPLNFECVLVAKHVYASLISDIERSRD